MSRNWKADVTRSVRLTAAALSVTLALIATDQPTSGATTGSSKTTSTYLLYAGHGVAVVATEDVTTGCSSVFLTNNMIQWRNVSPPVRIPPHWRKGLCAYVWSDAYFVSPSDGWLVATNGADVDTILRHTVNGGKSWTTDPSEYTGSAGGTDTISFVNVTLGWRQQFGFGSNGNYALQRTENGGATWSTRSPNPGDPAPSPMTCSQRHRSASRRFHGTR